MVLVDKNPDLILKPGLFFGFKYLGFKNKKSTLQFQNLNPDLIIISYNE